MVDGLEVGEVVVLKHHTPAFQFPNACSDIGHPEADGRVLGLGTARLWKQGQRTAANQVDKLSIGPQLSWLQTQAFFVESTSTRHIHHRQHRRHSRMAQHKNSFARRCGFMALSRADQA
jgi:hypothetical protein